MKHYNIPIFISHFGCPHTCVFCNQVKINGRETDVTCSDIKEIIEEHLEILPKNSVKEVAFFGGTFTGIDKRIQEGYLATVKPYIDAGLVDGIRLSTRPDYINEKILDLLLKYGVTTIELGVQSLDDEVLSRSERGYKSNIVEAASTLIKSYGFKLGIQVMPGLPGSTNKTDYKTAERVVEIKPDMVRIYPTLVINNTKLEKMYYDKEYSPMELEEAVMRVLPIMVLFELNDINIIRVGLQPSDDLCEEGVIKAGPFHPAFKETIETEIYGRFLRSLNLETLDIVTHEKNISKIVGMNKKNKLFFGKKMTIKGDNSLSLEKVVVNRIEYTRKEILNKILESGIL
ncbi:MULTISPECIES: elongator complex protein 3 [Psychrilyobacter]|uniref:Radical SAM protein n=1 Tax=Psychrilyobacter piezotolerans TaxID=2293438 RepID=A0ABX9KLD6_9FUSO|nr:MULTISPECIES: radical SAM protein [Psychrilyobacter]MCS5421778.1 radical SAM protein [Psychrilyobacter sp. S5]NDI76459.1 radical SAM protein [Psychrilyobacter piezotolerans]RDE66053.1 radical SAM protein [Psychrilyobacter sp. S5]REI43231.1 radical SAM protein [Psychrilyobacter piezotolerans]